MRAKGKKIASVAGIGVVALVVFGASCWKTILAEYQHYRLGIHLTIERAGAPAKFLLTIENRSAEVRRIWRMKYSRGWQSISVLLQEKGERKVEILRRNGPLDLRVNGVSTGITGSGDFTVLTPLSHSILPGQKLRLPFDLRDGSWVIPDGVDLLKKTYFIKPRLDIGPTPEAEKHGVVVGRFESVWK